MRRTRRMLSKLVSCLLSMCLVVSSVGTIPAFATPARSKPAPREILEKRTIFSKTYDNGDGTYSYEAYAAPVHFRDDSNGLYLPIDSSLEETGPVAARRWRNRANAFEVSLPSAIGADRWVSIESTQGAVSMRPITPQRSGAAVSRDATGQLAPMLGSGVDYRAAFAGADVEYDSNARGLKETIVLSQWSGANVFSFALRTKGLRPEIDPNGGIAYYSAESTVPAFFSPPPWMMDSAEGTGDGAYSTAVHFELTRDGLDWRLDVVADSTWLADPARVYPVRIDPTTEYSWVVSSDLYDTYVASGNPTSNYGTSTLLRAGYWSESGMGTCRTLVKPPVQDFLSGADADLYDVINASLKMYCYGTASGQDVDVNVSQINDYWLVNEVTWNTKPGYAIEGATRRVSPVPGLQTFDVTPIVDRWVSGESPMYGVMVSGPGSSNSPKFYSFESASSSTPVMYIRYSFRPRVTMIDPGADVPISGSPVLRWDFFDAGGKAQKSARFEIKRSGEDAAFWSSPVYGVEPAQNSLELTDATLESQLVPGRYYIRARVAAAVPGENDAWSLWADWTPFDVAALTAGSDGLGVLGYHASDDVGGGARVDLATGQLQISRSDFSGPGTGDSLGVSMVYSSAVTTDAGYGRGWRLALPSLAAASVATDQIAPNPGFESGPDANGDPTGWSVSDTAKVSRDTVQKRTGDASLKLSYTTAYASWWVSDVALDCDSRLTVPGQRYDVSYWVKTSGVTVDPNATEQGVRARIVWYVDTGSTGHEEEVGSSLGEGFIQGTSTGWVQRTVSAVAPPGARRARLLIDAKNLKGTAWIDDVEWHDGSRVLTSASGTTRTFRQAGAGQYTRDPLAPGLSLESTNAAVGARVSSSTVGGSITQLSVDGVSTGAASGTGQYDAVPTDASGANWLQYDLKRPRMIESVRLYLWDGEEAAPRSYTYFIRVNQTGKEADWTDAGSSLASPKTGSGWQTVTFDPVRARSVRVYALANTSNSLFHVLELELPILKISGAPVSFDAAGNLRATADESDNVVKYTREGSRVIAVEESDQRGVDLHWGQDSRLAGLDWRGLDSNGVASVEEDVASYDYDDSARTVTISQPGTSGPVASAVLAYDTDGRITGVTDADGQSTTIQYTNGKVSSILRGPAGLRVTTTYAYSGNASEPVVTITTSGEDGTSLTRSVKMSAALGYQAIETAVDPSGANLVTTAEYDCYGHARSVTGPAGTDAIDTDSHGQAWGLTEKGSRETTATYENDRLKSSTDALGNVTWTTYDECGRPTDSSVSVSDETSAGVYTTAVDYDEWGNQVVDAAGGSGSGTFNKLLNVGFESNPGTDGWTGSTQGFTWKTVSSLPFTQSYLGNRVAYLAATSENDAYMYSAEMSASGGATYTIEAWVAGTGTLYLKAYDADGGQLCKTPVARSVSGALTSETRLRRIAATWVAPAGAKTMRVHPMVAAGANVMVIDNIRLEKASSAGDDDLLDNGSFEIGSGTTVTNWTPRAAGSGTGDIQAREKGSSVSGSYLIHVKTTEDQLGYFVSEWIPVKPGERYTFGSYLAITGYKNSPGNAAILLQEGNASKEVDDANPYPRATESSLRGNQSWRRYTGSYTAREGISYVRVYLRAWNIGADVYFDGAFVRPAATQAVHEFDDATHSFEVTQTTNTGHVLTDYFDARGRSRLTTFRSAATCPTSTVLSATEYDAAGRLSAVDVRATADTTISASYTYTPAGRLRTLTDPNDHTSTIDYDTAGRVTAVTAPSGLVSALSYDALGRLKATFRPGTGDSVRLTQSTYDSAGRPSTTAYFDAADATATVGTTYYDSASRATTLTLTGETTASAVSTYDTLSRITGLSLTGPGGNASISTVYDIGDRPLSTSWSAFGTSGSVTGVYATTGQWLSTSSVGRTYNFAWSGSGSLDSVFSARAVTNFGKDTYGRAASVRTGFTGPAGTTGPYASYELSYDDFDRVSAIAATGPTIASQEEFGYDLAGRLTSWTRDGAQTTYAYDRSGNMTSADAAGTQTTFAYDVDDALVSSTAGSIVTTYGNDVLGRRTSQRSSSATTTTSFGYDAMGHLAHFASAEASATYRYGASGMREVKVLARGGQVTTTSVLWAGNAPVVEQDGDGTTLSYLYGPGGLPLSVQVTRDGGSATYDYLTDGLGSVTALVGPDGVVAATYTYDPWGAVISVGGADTWLASRQPLRYRGYYLDSESGLYYLPARYYDPATRRFLSADPATPSAGSPQSLNRYAYCEDDPVGNTDSSGARIDAGGGMTDSSFAAAARSTVWGVLKWTSKHRPKYMSSAMRALKRSYVGKYGSGGPPKASFGDMPVPSFRWAVGPSRAETQAVGDGTPYGRNNTRLAFSAPGPVDYSLAVAGTAMDFCGPPVPWAFGIAIDVAAYGTYYHPRRQRGEGTLGDEIAGLACAIPGGSEVSLLWNIGAALLKGLGDLLQ